MASKRKKAAVPRKRAVRKSVSGPGATYRRYLKIALALPGTEESTSYGTPSVKVKGKLLSRLRTEAEGGLALVCDFIDREILLQADPDVFYLTDHYNNYPMVLIRLERIRNDALIDLVQRAWRMRAPPRLVREFKP